MSRMARHAQLIGLGVVLLSSACLESTFEGTGLGDDMGAPDTDSADGGLSDAVMDSADAAPDAPIADTMADPLTDPDGGTTDTPDDTGRDAESDATDRDAGNDPGPYVPARYPSETLRSPLTEFVADQLRAIAEADMSRADHVFMKVGASGTVNTNLLYCFAGPAQPQYDLELAGRASLTDTIEWFREGDAADDTPFDRATLAAVEGRSAVWAITGDPSPLEQEVAAINPRFAFINYGTNDMQLGTTYQSALWPFYENFSKLLDQTVSLGIIPIISGLNPRSDSATAALWVPAYNAVTRGIAERRQIPYLNLYEAMIDLPFMGLISDGIHGNSYRVDGASQPCVFTPAGLQFNYNVRNLLSIEVLHDVRQVVLDDASAPDPSDDPYLGTGSPQDPFVIDRLPFTHWADTSQSPHELMAGYPACDAGQNEGGSEYYYRLELESQTRVRAMVFDGAGVDIDVHVLDGTGAASSCVARHDRIVQRPLAAGAWTFTLDSFVSGGVAREGEYLFVVLECEEGDTACN